MGPRCEDDKEVRILNRVVKRMPTKIAYQADDKHLARLLEELGFDDKTKGHVAPLAKDHGEVDDDDEPLDDQEARRYRRLAATINDLATDRPDLQCTASVLGRTMSRPIGRSWTNLKKTARYLKEHWEVVYEYFAAQAGEVQELVRFWDLVRAGCKISRRSTSGGMVTLGGGYFRSWADRQATICSAIVGGSGISLSDYGGGGDASAEVHDDGPRVGDRWREVVRRCQRCAVHGEPPGGRQDPALGGSVLVVARLGNAMSGGSPQGGRQAEPS